MEHNNPFLLPLKELPESPDLGIRHLSAVFRHTTNSYKYYWLLAILEMVKNGLSRLPINQLAAEMLAQAWYPVLYFRLNFGPEDQIGSLVLQLRDLCGLPKNSRRENIREAILTPLFQDAGFEEAFHKLMRYVPQRFLTPWFVTFLRGIPDHKKDRQIQSLARESFKKPDPPLYFLDIDSLGIVLQIHPVWMDYMTQNIRIVRDFVLWNLVDYLRQRNPHVPNLPEKLFPPEHRDMHIANGYWKTVLHQKNLRCPYSGALIPSRGFSLDHFIPWSFVCHDQLWNLVPVSKSINSAKSDCLPELGRYLRPFTNLQHEALQAFLNQESHRHKSWVEDFTLLFRCDAQSLRELSPEQFHRVMKDTLVPLEQIAANMGFHRDWRYEG